MPEPNKADLSLSKGPRKSIRFSKAQWRKVKQAADLESRRRGHQIDVGSFFRDEGMRRIDEILAAEDPIAAVGESRPRAVHA